MEGFKGFSGRKLPLIFLTFGYLGETKAVLLMRLSLLF